MTRTQCLALAALFLPVACAPNAVESEDRGTAVARLRGEAIHQAELDEWLRADLFEQATAGKDAASLYEFHSEGLERMIASQLLREESERLGLEVSELHARTVADATVSEEGIAAFYEDNRERLVESSLEELTPRIRDYLEQQRQAEVWSGFVEGLHEQARVEILIEMPRLEVAPSGPALGPESAPVTIVEFSDFNCPFCQRVGPTLKELRDRYPEQVRIVFRHFPLEMHPRARPIAEASVCADEQGAFWPFHNGVFETAAPLADDEIRAVAGSAGLDLSVFDACLASGRAARVVEQDMADGAAAGVTGTPAFFVNGIRLSGAQPVEAFVRVIDDELAATPPAAPSS